MTPKDNHQPQSVIKQMVDRFLSWKLPADFQPDAGIKYDKLGHHPNHPPAGTNLFTATQAEAMVRHMLAAPEPLANTDTASHPPPATIDIDGMLKVMLLIAIKHAKDGGSSSLQTLHMYCSSDDYAYYKTQITDLITEKENRARVDYARELAQAGNEFGRKAGSPEVGWAHIRDLIQATLKSKGRDK